MQPLIESEMFRRLKTTLLIVRHRKIHLFFENIHRNTSDHSQMRQKPAEVFGFDGDVVRGIEKDWVRLADLPAKVHPVIDTSYLYSPLKIGYYSGVRYPADKLQTLISQSRTTSTTTHGRSFDGGLGASPSRPSTAPSENK